MMSYGFCNLLIFFRKNITSQTPKRENHLQTPVFRLIIANTTVKPVPETAVFFSTKENRRTLPPYTESNRRNIP